jgi:N-acetylglucosaminyl-diphospho-decaprenol L-rhamnosyltransferase
MKPDNAGMGMSSDFATCKTMESDGVSSPNDPAASVLIVNYNSGPHLADTLRALASQTVSNVKIISIDNQSSDDSFAAAQAAVAGDERFRFVKAQSNIGFAAGNNFAASMARGPWLALLNPDATPEPDWLEKLLVATRRHPDAVMFGSTQIDAVDPQRLDGAGDHYMATGIPWRGGHGWPVSRLLPEGEVFATCAAACLISADAFHEIGGFDERFFCYVEDVDLAFRLRLMGHRCIQVPTAVVHHVGTRAAGPEHARFADECGTRNLIWCFVKCMPGPLFWPLLPLHFLSVALRAVMVGKFSSVCAGVISALRGLSHVWESRQAIQRVRRATWWQIAVVLSWNPIAYLRRAP